ncbi:MAG: hypothetical protein R2705_07360 [Ilumatobacteraceae bacterium]
MADPYPIWDDLREQCPIAHSERFGGSWLPTTYADVAAMAHDVEHFSCGHVGVVPPPPDVDVVLHLPPISADGDEHKWTRGCWLPWFSHRRVDGYEPFTRDLCNRLIDGFIETGQAMPPPATPSRSRSESSPAVLGVPDDMSDTFTGWVRDARVRPR